MMEMLFSLYNSISLARLELDVSHLTLKLRVCITDSHNPQFVRMLGRDS